ncbi:MAG: helix-turn-helix domain-containing protein [Pseudomonadota bacterium]
MTKARQAGIYTGGKPRIDRETVKDLASAGIGPAAIARQLGVSRMSVYRILKETNSAVAKR